ncbi:hypothetical protein ACFQV5_00895 [Paenibacillus sp. GCM10028914]
MKPLRVWIVLPIAVVSKFLINYLLTWMKFRDKGDRSASPESFCPLHYSDVGQLDIAKETYLREWMHIQTIILERFLALT